MDEKNKKTVVFEFNEPIAITVESCLDEPDDKIMEKVIKKLVSQVHNFNKNGILDGVKLEDHEVMAGLPVRTASGKYGVILTKRRENDELKIKMVFIGEQYEWSKERAKWVGNPNLSHLLKVDKDISVDQFITEANIPKRDFFGFFREGDIGYYVNDNEIHPVAIASYKKAVLINYDKTKMFNINDTDKKCIFETKEEAEKYLQYSLNKQMPHLRF